MGSTDSNVELTFVDGFVPQLTAGKYTLTAKQTVVFETADLETGGTTRQHLQVPDESTTFWVRGPRFALAPDEIFARHPADGHKGAFSSTLPHIVFRRKALPWERQIDPTSSGSSDPTIPPDPWLALLVFDEEELQDWPFKDCALTEVRVPTGGQRPPDIELDPWEKDPSGSTEGGPGGNRCTVLDIPLALFRKVAPLRSELRHLVHARLAGTHDKEDIYGIGDGWFSVMIANRLPADGMRNVAVLVSLEGHAGLMGPEETPPDLKEAQVRLVVLDHWSFRCADETFEEVVTHLHKDAKGQDKDHWLRMSQPQGGSGVVSKALARGYVPLQHRLRDGGSTVSWYRGPLVPEMIQADSHKWIFGNADSALQYDPSTGLMNASLASAWQLGRLLALQAPEFARALFVYDNSHVSDGLKAEAESALGALMPDTEMTIPQEAQQVNQDDLLVALALECAGSKAGPG